MNSKDITSTQITKIFYEELNKFLLTKNIPLTIVNIQIGDNHASLTHSKIIEKTLTKETNINVKTVHFDTISYQELINYIKNLNSDSTITGIMLELPLPDYLNPYERQILDTISKDKDIEGLTSTSLGQLFTNNPNLIPCTPLSIITLLKSSNIKLSGKTIAILNRNNHIGKPLAHLLLNNNATPIICHSKTSNLKEITKTCDIVISALNKREYLTKDYFKEDAIVIDIGVHKNNQDKIVGDVNYKDVYNKVSLITPPTNSIGPMTICMLAYNTAKSIYEIEINQLLDQAISKAQSI